MKESTIEFAKVMDDVAVLRIQGRGTFQNSMDLQNLTRSLLEQNPNVRFIIDLDKCVTLDSTFMGTLAGISVEQNKAGHGYLTVLNTHEHTLHLLRNLGLAYILDIREWTDSTTAHEKEFQKVASDHSATKFEQIIHMIKAHEQLIDLDSQNEVRFQSVLKYLKESLNQEKMRQDQGDDPDQKKEDE
ncbi:STAS domain-containing protein [Candidatus Sumerlaeota bacterium]|nr:STAS domain-containing protein [Candidatus Sumerlaeota bacterium]